MATKKPKRIEPSLVYCGDDKWEISVENNSSCYIKIQSNNSAIDMRLAILNCTVDQLRLLGHMFHNKADELQGI